MYILKSITASDLERYVFTTGKRVNVSDRVEYQLPEFIREDDRQFVNLLLEYYRSQEKTGRPYDVLNNIINYLDLDNYGSEGLSG